MARKPILFPKKFLWGASTSAHQVEGGNHNQWSVWELENAKALAAQASYQYGDLDSWSRIEKLALTPANYVSRRASGHYTRYEEDFDLLKSMNCNSFRFSIEWSRIEPNEGEWNAEAIDHYRKYLSALRERDIEPVVTLFHFTLPIWFSEMGGFAKRSNIKYFLWFVEKVIDEFGADLKWIITINEPGVYASQSYGEGVWPPNKMSKIKKWWVIENLITAHKKAAKLIHDSGEKYKVSMAYNINYTYPGDDAWLTQASTVVIDFFHNHYILLRTVQSNDFIGLNYYFSDCVYGYRTHNENKRVSDMGWDLQPANLRHVIEDLTERYDMPIMITENGLADANDEQRQWWLTQTIQAMLLSIKDGAHLIGYLHWSLLDNFEWDKGHWPRFGLVKVDYSTLKRTPRSSADAYARMIKKLQENR